MNGSGGCEVICRRINVRRAPFYAAAQPLSRNCIHDKSSLPILERDDVALPAEIEITPAMIRAGVAEFCACVQDSMFLKDSESVVRIYLSMARENYPSGQL